MVVRPETAPVESSLSDYQRRAMARTRIKDAFTAFAEWANEDYVAYEQAMMAKNENVESLQNFEREAEIRGISVDKLVDMIIGERRLKSRKLFRARYVKERALTAIEAASGDGIDAIAAQAVLEINEGMKDGSDHG